MNTICQQCAARLDPGAQSCDLCGARTSATDDVQSVLTEPSPEAGLPASAVFEEGSDRGTGRPQVAVRERTVPGPVDALSPAQYSGERAPQPILVASEKDPGIAAILGFLFGPLGLLYVSVKAALAMFAVNCVVLVLTLGFGLFLTWPVSAYVGYRAAIQRNERLRQELGAPAAVHAA